MCQRNATHSDWIWYLMENYCTCVIFRENICLRNVYWIWDFYLLLIYKTDKVKLLYEKVLNRN